MGINQISCKPGILMGFPVILDIFHSIAEFSDNTGFPYMLLNLSRIFDVGIAVHEI